jgi:hypothetical protein
MRYVFKYPWNFMTSVIDECLTNQWTGVNVDWEPTVNGNPQDAEDYAQFLNLFAGVLHEFGFQLNAGILDVLQRSHGYNCIYCALESNLELDSNSKYSDR